MGMIKRRIKYNAGFMRYLDELCFEKSKNSY